MSKRRDETTTVEWNGAFHTTHWTDIFDAMSHDEPRRQAALGELLGTYWKPIYCYLRCKGHGREAAKDLTQGFFHEVVLGRGLIQRADQAKGRFRTFLLTCLNRYAANVLRAETTKQRMPEGGLVRLEDVDWLNAPEPAHSASPLEAFDYAWASALLDQVVAEVAGECLETGNYTYWELFQARVLQPIMENADSPSHVAQFLAGCRPWRHTTFKLARRDHLRLVKVSKGDIREYTTLLGHGGAA
ncbi:sigma-70 family RNA polymerase sigma factor [bacterium]|nr:sigma-70 family RNA polymerase sigma factor [bacterium]